LLLLSVAMVAMAVADSSFAYLTAIGKYVTGGLSDIGWVAAFLLLAVAAVGSGAHPSATPTVAAEAAVGGARLRRLQCRFAGMVVPGDTVTFTAEPAGTGKLELRAVNQRGEPVLTKAAAEYG
jgi:MaoC like domain.